MERKAFAIVDRSFYKNGSLYYSDRSDVPGFTTWNPTFYGNAMVINGKVWPQMTLKAQKYRFIFLNGCQTRYLKLFFAN